jgi:hypothetical protein
MADTLAQTDNPDAKGASTPPGANLESTSDTVSAPAKGAPNESNQATEAPPDDDLALLIQKVKATITTSLDEQDFDKQLRKYIKKIKGWEDWSEHAKSAFAHMWAAQLLHNKAVDIKKDNKMDFTPVTGESYKKLVRLLTQRVRF